MKNTILALFATSLLISSAASAQDDGVKLAKMAGKALATYNMDRASNGAKLQEAKEKIDQALQTSEAQAISSAWITKGDVYLTIFEGESALRVVDPKAKFSGDNDALVAFEAYRKGYDLAQKKYEKSDAVKGIQGLEGHMINMAVEKYQYSNFDKAYYSFLGALNAHDILKANEQKSILDDAKQWNEITYFTGKSASLAKMHQEALQVFEKIEDKNADVYQSIYDAKIAMNDEAGAAKALEEGRRKFPEDPALLFTEINAYLKAGKLDELTGRLKQAIEQEPNNVGLYTTLGNVYDNLFQAALKEKDEAKTTGYFNEAKANYDQAIARDPKNVDAIYSLGGLYYNKAAYKTQEMNADPDNSVFTEAALQKMNAMSQEIMGYFDQALPYFQKAESLNPNDLNTLIALTEIYARKEDDLSLEFKRRQNVVNEGGKNANSYFRN